MVYKARKSVTARSHGPPVPSYAILFGFLLLPYFVHISRSLEPLLGLALFVFYGLVLMPLALAPHFGIYLNSNSLRDLRRTPCIGTIRRRSWAITSFFQSSSTILTSLLCLVTYPITHLNSILLSLSYFLFSILTFSLSIPTFVLSSFWHLHWQVFKWILDLHVALTKAKSFCLTLNQFLFLILLEHALMPRVTVVALYHLFGYCLLLYLYRSYYRGRCHPTHSAASVESRLSSTSSSSQTREGLQHSRAGYLSCTGQLMTARLGKAAAISTLLGATGYKYLQFDIAYTSVALAYLLVSQFSLGEPKSFPEWFKRWFFLEDDDEEEDTEEQQQQQELLFRNVLGVVALIISIILIIYNIIGPSILTISNATLAITTVIKYITNILQNILRLINSLFQEDTVDAITHASKSQVFQSYKFTPMFPETEALGNLLFCLTACYTNVLLPVTAINQRYSDHYQQYDAILQRFSRATKQECMRQEQCAVCLEQLKTGRRTTCGHVYHSHCLRSLLTTHNIRCPLCNTPL